MNQEQELIMRTVDTQKRQDSYPEPVAWVWSQVESVVLPGNRKIALKTTVYNAEIRTNSWSSCAIWRNDQWVNVWALEAEGMYSVRVFTACNIRASQGPEVFDLPDILQAVKQDAIEVRRVALEILCPG